MFCACLFGKAHIILYERFYAAKSTLKKILVYSHPSIAGEAVLNRRTALAHHSSLHLEECRAMGARQAGAALGNRR